MNFIFDLGAGMENRAEEGMGGGTEGKLLNYIENNHSSWRQLAFFFEGVGGGVSGNSMASLKIKQKKIMENSGFAKPGTRGS